MYAVTVTQRMWTVTAVGLCPGDPNDPAAGLKLPLSTVTHDRAIKLNILLNSRSDFFYSSIC